MQAFLAIAILLIVLMLQTVIVSSLPLLNGTADLVLLALVAWGLQDRSNSIWIWTILAGVVVGVVSALPLLVPVIGYLLVTAVARIVRRRVWQTPILAMFIVTFAGSVLFQGLVMGVLIFNGTSLPLLDSLNLVVLPGTLLNLLLALPIHAMAADLAQWVFPEGIEV